LAEVHTKYGEEFPFTSAHFEHSTWRKLGDEMMMRLIDHAIEKFIQNGKKPMSSGKLFFDGVSDPGYPKSF
jgi:hypothetical protein